MKMEFDKKATKETEKEGKDLRSLRLLHHSNTPFFQTTWHKPSRKIALLSEGLMGGLGTGRAGAAVGSAASAQPMVQKALQKNDITNERKEFIVKTRQRWRPWVGLALAWGLLALGVSTQTGKPPQPPPTPTGRAFRIGTPGTLGDCSSAAAINEAGRVVADRRQKTKAENERKTL
jgi:hypothetical protein